VTRSRASSREIATFSAMPGGAQAGAGHIVDGSGCVADNVLRMQYGHSTRNMRRTPRLDESFVHARGSSYGYSPDDMLELDALIAAKCKTPRAELGAARDAEGPAAVLRRVIERER